MSYYKDSVMNYTICNKDGVTFIEVASIKRSAVNPGEVTTIYYYNEDTPCDLGTIKVYVTDSWKKICIGRYKPCELKELAEECLNGPIDYAYLMIEAYFYNN